MITGMKGIMKMGKQTRKASFLPFSVYQKYAYVIPFAEQFVELRKGILGEKQVPKIARLTSRERKWLSIYQTRPTIVNVLTTFEGFYKSSDNLLYATYNGETVYLSEHLNVMAVNGRNFFYPKTMEEFIRNCSKLNENKRMPLYWGVNIMQELFKYRIERLTFGRRFELWYDNNSLWESFD